MGASSADAGRALEAGQRLSPQWRDAFLYACSALFAGVTALAMGIPLYRQWGQLAFGPYLVAALLMIVVARRTAGTDLRGGGGGRPGWPPS